MITQELEILTQHFDRFKEYPRCYHCKQEMTFEEEKAGKITYIGGMFDDLVHVECSSKKYAEYVAKQS